MIRSITPCPLDAIGLILYKLFRPYSSLLRVRTRARDADDLRAVRIVMRGVVLNKSGHRP